MDALSSYGSDSSGAGGDVSGSSIKAQIFTAAGVKSGPEFLVNTVTDDDQHSPSVTALADGNFIVTWTSADGATDDIKSQVFDPQVYAGDGASATVYGGSHGDHMTDGIGTEALYGEDGNDTVVVTSRIGADSFDGGDGIDTIDWSASAESGATFRLFLGTATNDVGIDETMTGFENLTGTANADTVYGTSGGNTISGGGGGDTLIGARGDDWLEGDGNNDTLRGDDGIDYLFGGTGADTMQGGLGGDTYFVDSAGDIVSDTFDLGAGFDYVSSSITYTIGPYIERLGLDGDDDIDGTGNLLNNHLFGNSGANTLSGLCRRRRHQRLFDGDDRLYGGIQNDTLDGGADDDALFGDSGIDTLIGGSNDDELDGGTGADIMEGGEDDDTYVVDNAADVVLEIANEGADTLNASVTYVLAAGQSVETLQTIDAAATTAINLTGNDLGNTIIGNAGNNFLVGGTDVDTLQGLAGNDAYIVDSPDRC